MSPILIMIAKRLALGVLTLFIVSMLIFGATELLPGDFAEEFLGQSATPETVAAIRRQLGLDLPMHIRYGEWLGVLPGWTSVNAEGVVTGRCLGAGMTAAEAPTHCGILQGEFGDSLSNRRPVADLLGTRLGNTLFLALYAAAIAVPLSLMLGILAALFRNSVFDRVVNASALTSISFPEFFVAYILIFWLAGMGGAFPSMATIRPTTDFVDKLYMTFLPALTLTLVVTAHMMRMARAAIINLLASPYIEMARLKGMSPMRVILRHALPNALAPIINVIALNLAYLITGVVVVEVVFVYPGLGQLMVDSVAARDMPVVQAVALIFAAAYVLLNLTADVLATLSNPRLVKRR
ncbi:MAG: ABC transporter permease [Nioella sp.]